MKDVARSGAAVAVPPPLPPGVGRGRTASRVVPTPPADADDAAVQAVEESSERTERWAGAKEAAAADAAEARGDGRVVAPPPQDLCVTVASRIPEMLAESMSLAGDDDPAAKR